MKSMGTEACPAARGHRIGHRPREPAAGLGRARPPCGSGLSAVRAHRREADARQVRDAPCASAVPHGRSRRQVRRHERALPRPAHEIALDEELLVGEQHDVPRASDVLRQFARGRRAATGREAAAANQRHERPRNLSVARTVSIEPEQHVWPYCIVSILDLFMEPDTAYRAGLERGRDPTVLFWPWCSGLAFLLVGLVVRAACARGRAGAGCADRPGAHLRGGAARGLRRGALHVDVIHSGRHSGMDPGASVHRVRHRRLSLPGRAQPRPAAIPVSSPAACSR